MDAYTNAEKENYGQLVREDERERIADVVESIARGNAIVTRSELATLARQIRENTL